MTNYCFHLKLTVGKSTGTLDLLAVTIFLLKLQMTVVGKVSYFQEKKSKVV